MMMDAIDIASLLRPVQVAVEAAGELILREWEREGGPRGSGDKAAVDEEIERLLHEQLIGLLDVDFWGEETCQRLTGQRFCWVVDPHDGTRDFLLGLPGSAISVALLRDGQPVLGVVYAPISPDRGRDCIAWAEGLPHLLRNGAAHPVDLSGSRLEAGEIVWLSAAAARKPHANIRLCAPARFVAMPSVAYRLARAAAGDGVAAVSLTSLSAHDVAAGHALLIGAGGVLLNQGGRPLGYRNMDLVCIRCFGGAAAACTVLAGRPWSQALEECNEAQRSLPMSPVFPPVQRLQRAFGCLATMLIGDNLGAQVEFMSATEIAERCASAPLTMRDGGTWNIQAGQPTDDGELALALARSLVELGGFSATDVAQRYVAWLRSEPFDVGNTTRQALLGPLRQPALAVDEACRAHASVRSQANGALMRVAPIGIAAHGRPALAARWARQDALLTHPHGVCQEASAAYAAAIAAAVAGADRQAMLDAALAVLLPSADGDAVKQVLLAAAAGERPDDYQQQMGWVLIALQNAFYHLLAGNTVGHALNETIRQGGDTDTNACIAGALLGAVDGIARLDWAQLGPLLSCRAHPQSLRPRPMVCWPDDAGVLAQRLLMLGADNAC
ncbi:inositol monophosphatase family protein [Pseudomonas lopnurensis]|uniref:inositol monophosphatase family protein n=1 Tax=Pseudomonas lopnurensis TaxID=1477517 RepID=UPI00187A2CB5|nr:inositol monophosphatase family protein [Pseudomonas lopnurensis]MBE7373944.1 ADP-ribosylglycohydrolase family protein [Pseudomonas lopnurensis]